MTGRRRPAASSAIYHIADRAAWAAAGASYLPEAFEADGFVHCSRWSQLPGVSRAIFGGRTDLVVLEIDAESVGSAVVYEDLYESGEEFPHVYGPIPRVAVVAELALEWPLPDQPAIVRRGL